jgi:hypothetical protein
MDPLHGGDDMLEDMKECFTNEVHVHIIFCMFILTSEKSFNLCYLLSFSHIVDGVFW